MLGFFVATVAIVGLQVSKDVLRKMKEAKFVNELAQVQTAVSNYYIEYSVYPVVSDSATLIKMLSGESKEGNQRQITFISLKPSDLDAKGDLLDPWGTPIELSVTADGKIHVHSAGPDKIFGTQDDIANQ